jgi:hypothetical protein
MPAIDGYSEVGVNECWAFLLLVVSDAWRGEWSCAQYERLRKAIQGTHR